MNNQYHHVLSYLPDKHLFQIYLIILTYMYTYLLQQLYRRKNRRRILLVVLCILIIISFTNVAVLDTLHNLDEPLLVDEEQYQSAPPFEHLIPSDPFDLYWTMWNTNQSTFRSRRFLVLESLFIHHPQATVIMLSTTLNDEKLFQPFRRRGYKIYSFPISTRHLLRWNWYSNHETRDFLLTWNTTGYYFYSHLTDYVRTIALYIYGGTYLDMDALILQPLPNEEFIGLDQAGLHEPCYLCIKNTSNLYLAPGVMRFLPHRNVLRIILEKTFTRERYNPKCFNCAGPTPYTWYIIEALENNDSELASLQLLQPHRLYPIMWTEISDIFDNVEDDISLHLADLMKRSYSLHYFGHVSDEFDISRGSLMDSLFDRYDLGDLRPKISDRDQLNNDARLVCPSLYVYTRRKQGRFIGRDVMYLRLNKRLDNEATRWNIKLHVANGTIILPRKTSLSNLNQAQINRIFNEIKYKPFESTSIDTLMISVNSETVSVSCSLTILIFSKWVTILTKTMGSPDRLPVVQRLVTSIHRYFSQTMVLVASDSGQPIDKISLLNFTSSDNINGYDLTKNIVIHDLPEDSGLSKCRNYLLNETRTPFFFLLDDDFELEEDSHLDILLELIYTYQYIDIIAGKIPEDIEEFNDFSGVFLRYGQTLQLVNNVSDASKDLLLFPQSANEEVNDENPCRRVDFVPNVFMGRRETFRSIRWDDEFKVGEHEDFFLRFAEANRHVYTCRFINVHHRQIPWWKRKDEPYFEKRARVHKYFEKMLKKHNLKRLMTFNHINVDLNLNCSGTCNDDIDNN